MSLCHTEGSIILSATVQVINCIYSSDVSLGARYALIQKVSMDVGVLLRIPLSFPLSWVSFTCRQFGPLKAKQLKKEKKNILRGVVLARKELL